MDEIKKIEQIMEEWREARRKKGLPVSNEGTRTYWNAHKKHNKIWEKQWKNTQKGK